MHVISMLAMLFGPLLVVLVASRLGRTYLYVSVATLILTTTVIAGKLVPFGGFLVSAGTPLYAAIFLATDILSEYHGKEYARRAVWIGFAVNIFFVVLGLLVLGLPSGTDPISKALDTLFTFTPRLVLGGMIAYLVSQNIDILTFHALKAKTKGRWLFLRNTLSTASSQLIDTTLVYSIAFWGIVPNLWKVILINWIVKVLVAAVDTPFIYMARTSGAPNAED